MNHKEEELHEDVALISKAIREIQKRVIEADKLQKQTGVSDCFSQIFTSHVVWKKEFVISYVQLHHGMYNEIVIEGLTEFVNPDAYKNGLFIISSKYLLFCGLKMWSKV